MMFPPDWQCFSPECMNHVKMVFAKKDKCPICGASRPSSSTRTRGSERMSGSEFRRFNPARSDVSQGRDTRDDRDSMARSLVGSHACLAPPPSGFQVGSSGNHVTLQAETYHPVPLQDVSTEGQVERSVGGLALTVRSTVELNECGVSSPGFQVGSFQSRVMLPAETSHPGPL